MPTVSIVMPVRDSAATVERAVASCLAQAYPALVEVVLAEGRSVDDSRAVIERLAAADPRVIVVDNPTGSTPSGLNSAIRATSGDVIVRCDAHSELDPRYVATAVARLEATGAGVVGGVQEAVGETPIERAVAYAMANPLGSGGAAYRGGREPGIAETVYLGAFRRAALADIGLYDESLHRNQDYELNHRMSAAGHTVFFDPALRVRYHPRSTLRTLWRQYFDYGRWKRLVIRRLPESLHPRQLAAPALIVGLAGSAVLATTGRRRAAAVVPGAYVAGVATAAIGETLRHRDPAGLLVAIVLPIMHLAWGAGFWRGGVAERGARIARLPAAG